MTSFKDFYNNIEEFSKEIDTEIASTSPLTQGLISSTIIGSVGQVLLPTIGMLSVFSNAEKVEKFSKEVANYATSEDVISSLSEQIGTPTQDETEEEFVERASTILRNILKKKFKI
ncbi:hypothetical protein [Aulosira sp. FACHB-615]|uniref:hypothetical protein n=1 Tax=Aulosira sp. FACHB-615 TaxID=2692777 RepID=UPI001689E089|nr:hypothetical protein [Aulosira sp. FACHB-615]MBD2492410.1 hypothetical protein [Aulosira sp. FACHB-615]